MFMQFSRAGGSAPSRPSTRPSNATFYISKRHRRDQCRRRTLSRATGRAIRRVDDVVHAAVLDGSLVRVKIWTPSGTIVYSDEPRLIGRPSARHEEQSR